ncbi:SOS response-associated peptidase [Longispora sp. NPDC051575]|uniref:SOS response-associated peptidase n=1 Tax=Longispora sp. NPDC051575 TaxID=3154943 RepID=UPI00342DC795
MCGRFVNSRSPEDLGVEFDVDQSVLSERLAPDYNIAPTKKVYAVLDRPGDVPERQLRVLTWGLVPSWAKDRSNAAKLSNARIETAAEKPSFARAFKSRRAVIPADGYFEWRRQDGGVKQPFYLHRPDGASLRLAALYELWRDPTREAGHPDAWWWSATILTTESTGELRDIHDRTPLTVRPGALDAWLSTGPSHPDELRALLAPSTEELVARPVSTLVNSVRNNGPHLLEEYVEAAPTLF